MPRIRVRRPRCADPSDSLMVECRRRKGHRGDHRAALRWPRRVPRVADPDRQPSGAELAMQRAWAPILEQQLAASMLRRPAMTGTVPIVVVNRDTEHDDNG